MARGARVVTVRFSAGDPGYRGANQGMHLRLAVMRTGQRLGKRKLRVIVLLVRIIKLLRIKVIQGHASRKLPGASVRK